MQNDPSTGKQNLVDLLSVNVVDTQNTLLKFGFIILKNHKSVIKKKIIAYDGFIL